MCDVYKIGVARRKRGPIPVKRILFPDVREFMPALIERRKALYNTFDLM